MSILDGMPEEELAAARHLFKSQVEPLVSEIAALKNEIKSMERQTITLKHYLAQKEAELTGMQTVISFLSEKPQLPELPKFFGTMTSTNYTSARILPDVIGDVDPDQIRKISVVVNAPTLDG